MKTNPPFMKSLHSGVKSRAVYVLLLMCLLFPSCKQNDKTPDGNNTEVQSDTVAATPTADSDSDKSFLADAAIVNMEEIDLGKLAQEKGVSKDVKDFGKMMVDGHTKSLNELKDLAAQKGIILPTEISEKGKAAKEELTNADAKSFDKLYASKMVDGHKETIAKFETERDNGSDAEIKAWAAKTLPDLQMHLDHALMVQQKLK